jgi:CO/xanthine dehydrogenase FAD-binding subunit
MEGDKCADAKIALASAGPTPMRIKKAEALMIGEPIDEKLIEEVGKKVSEESRFRDSFRGAAALKRENAGRLAKAAIKQAVEQIKFGCS